MGAPQDRPALARRAAVPVLTVLLVASLAVGGYLWLTTVRWQADSATWEARARDHADTVADQRAALKAVDAELVAAREQLAAATDRITDLANEKAQLGDRNVASQQDLDQQTRVSASAGAVANALDACIQAQSSLVAELRERVAAGPDGPRTAVRAATEEADALCAQAADAHEKLRRDLGQDPAPATTQGPAKGSAP